MGDIASWSKDHLLAFDLDQNMPDFDLDQNFTRQRQNRRQTPFSCFHRWGKRFDGYIPCCQLQWRGQGRNPSIHPHISHQLIPRRQRWQKGLDIGVGKGGYHFRVIGISGNPPVILAPRFSVCWSGSQGERIDHHNNHCHGSPTYTIQGGFFESISMYMCYINVLKCT